MERSSNMIRAGRRAGFTLVEIMVTILIMSGLLVAMSQILTSARRVRDNIHNMQENQLAGPAILDLIERDLRGILIYNRPANALLRVRDRSLGGSDADSLDFVTSDNARLLTEDGQRFVRADYNEVGYRLKPNPDDDEFLMIYRREGFGVDDHIGESFDEGRYSFLHDRVQGFSIIAYAEDGPDADEYDSWNSGDDEETGLPTRLEIELTLENRQRIHREALFHQPSEDLQVTYRRIIRISEQLHLALEVQPLPVIPQVPSPAIDSAAPAGDGLSASPGGGRPPGGGDQGIPGGVPPVDGIPGGGGGGSGAGGLGGILGGVGGG